MVRGTIRILAALAAALSSVPAAAQNAEFAVEEYGRVSCAQFNTAHLNKEGVAYARIMGFVQGYLTAANRYETDTFDLSPWHNAPAFDLILDKRCKDRPKDTLIATLQLMVSSFRPLRVAKPSPMVKVSDGKGGYMLVYDTILRRAEAVLKARGLLGAARITPAAATMGGKPVAYDYSPEVREAFRKYQEAKGLDQTGMPDTASLWLLLNP